MAEAWEQESLDSLQERHLRSRRGLVLAQDAYVAALHDEAVLAVQVGHALSTGGRMSRAEAEVELARRA